jgi:hypothetical protein
MKRFLLLFFSFLIALNVWAQERVITGKVTSSEDGSALPGVNVLVKGTTNGTVSDSGGSFRISISGSNATLSLSFIGFISQDVEVGARTTIDVIMAPDVKQLSEVVVVGYGTQIKQDLTGNIAEQQAC